MEHPQALCPLPPPGWRRGRLLPQPLSAGVENHFTLRVNWSRDIINICDLAINVDNSTVNARIQKYFKEQQLTLVFSNGVCFEEVIFFQGLCPFSSYTTFPEYHSLVTYITVKW